MNQLIYLKIFIIKAIDWKARNGIVILRVSLGAVFFWFGFVKFFPNLSLAEAIASKTIFALSDGFDGFIDKNISMPVLAIWECAIGIGLLSGRFMKITLFLLYLQMIGTLTPLIIFRNETWSGVFLVPTLLGQYIIKNVVLISAGIVIGATTNGGALISNPNVAVKAVHLQTLYFRYKRRYNQDPKYKI
ncbi:hypothetical protein ASG01_15055 [Chryseobacterium sp. Leaf180]|nr:hypothetical protein ASG01_15055 [Chryseobacterium sp. Leaf180]